MRKLVYLMLFVFTVFHVSAQTNPPFKQLPVYGEPEYNAKSVPGNNQQYMTGFAYSESDPSRLYMSQDVGGVWVSRDAGKNWNTLKNRGLMTRFMTAIEVDPLDKNRLFVVGSCEDWDALHRNTQGIYMSTDGGINWQRVSTRSEIGFIRRTTHLISYAPSSKDAGLGYATRWYTAISEFNGSATIVSDDGFMYSDDGGVTWIETRKLDAATFGNDIYGIRTHPLNKEVVYMYGSAGLTRFDDATNATGSFTKLSGFNGLPSGTIGSDIYISPNGNTLIVGVAGAGIYKSTDAGGSWTEVYAYTGLVKCFVNPGFPDVMYATASSSGGQVRVTQNGGVSWNTTVVVTPVPGFSGNWNTRIYGSFAAVVPDPRNASRAFAQGNAMFFQTDNGGNNWYPSNGYFNGNQITGSFEQMFDPINPDKFTYFMVDVGVRSTTNRGKWFTKDNNINDFVASKTCRAGALHPVASTNIVLACVNASTGELLRSTDNGTVWTSVRPDLRKRWYIFFDQQDPNYVYQWQERSADAGLTWTQLTIPGATDPVISGMSYQDGKVIYAVDVASPGTKVYRSNDRGANWYLAFTSPTKLTSPIDQQFSFRVNPSDHNIVYTTGTNKLTKWDLTNPASPVSTQLQIMPTPEAGFHISRFAMDRRFPDVMYAANMKQGTANKFFRSEDGGTTWENLSDGIAGTSIGGLEVSPLTGEVFVSTPNGILVLPPPYATTEAEKAKMAYYTTAWSNSLLDQAYAASVSGQSPYGGLATPVPGSIQAEHFDEGGKGAAYYDDEVKMGDALFRPADFVDVVADAGADNGYFVSKTTRGEWMEYTINVAAATYDIGLKYSSVSASPGSVRVLVDGIQVGIFTNLTSTGGSSVFSTVKLEGISLTAGSSRILRLEIMEGGELNLDAVEFETQTTLPVVLEHFTAKKLTENARNSALINWTTTSETVSSHFEVERSGDLRSWNKIASVNSNEESSERKNYEYTDANPNSGINYYRLRMVDLDRSFSFSRIEAVDFGDAGQRLIVFPVPANESVHFKDTNYAEIAEITVLDINSRLMHQARKMSESGINLEGYAPGTYLISVTDKSGGVNTGKFVVQK